MSGIAHATFSEFLSDPETLGTYFAAGSWRGWKIIAKAIYGEKLSMKETECFKSIAGDRDPPNRRVREVWLIVGRRGGKDSFASALAAYHSAAIDYQGILRPGEKVSVQCLACDKRQARIILNYTRGYFVRKPLLSSLVENDVAEGFDLSNGCEGRVFTNNIATVRAVAPAVLIMAEIAFYPANDSSSATAYDVYQSTIPAPATGAGPPIC